MYRSVLKTGRLIDEQDLSEFDESNSLSTTFIMNYWKGGGPGNVYTLSCLFKDAGYPSRVFSFYSFEDIPVFIRNKLKLVKKAYGADTKTPTGNLSSKNVMFLLFTNPTFITSAPFLFKERILELSTLSHHEVDGKLIATNWQTIYSAFDYVNKNVEKILYFLQAYEIDFSENYFYIKMADKTFKLPIRRFTQSKWLTSYLDIKYSCKTSYIGRGVAHVIFKPLHIEKSRKITTIVRRDKNKGFELFVKDINKLWCERNDFEVLLFGESPDFIRHMMTFPYTYLGWISDDSRLAEIYNEGFFVNTGTNEALQIPPFEATSCGSAVVLTNIPRSKEYALNYKSCINAGPFGYRNISNVISELLDSDILRNAISLNAVYTTNNYDWNEVMEKFVAILKKEEYL